MVAKFFGNFSLVDIRAIYSAAKLLVALSRNDEDLAKVEAFLLDPQNGLVRRFQNKIQKFKLNHQKKGAGSELNKVQNEIKILIADHKIYLRRKAEIHGN